MFPGIDIIGIQRFTSACERTPKLQERLFTHREIMELQAKNMTSWAAHFAGKEAILKALGTGLRGLSWHDIEILSNDLGEPVVSLTERAEQFVRARGGTQIRLSLSHEKEYAIGMAILY
ncbi:holo-ACP synthase [Desulfitobacterium dichloroeliminans]|nr:holo-ACP synthase [Desulfitobacterium dichloroeliminans]